MIFFIHMPKTAGSSLRRLVLEQYNFAKINKICILPGNFHGNHQLPKNCLNKINSGKIDLIYGHFSYGAHLHCNIKDLQKSPKSCQVSNSSDFSQLPSNLKYVTFFREPLARTVSGFSYAMQSPRNHNYNIVKKYNFDFETFISATESWEFVNPYCRTLCTPKDQKDKEMSEAHLHSAKENLRKHFLFFGLQEKFELSVAILADLLNWQIKKIATENVATSSKRDLKLTKKAKEIFYAKNQLDSRLYQFVLAEFKKLTAGKEIKDSEKLKSDNANKPDNLIDRLTYLSKLTLAKLNCSM